MVGLTMIDQIAIGVTSVTAVWLSQDSRPRWRRWAGIFGLIGQPFWMYTSWKASQWGIFGLCFLYTYCWVRGLRQQWWR
jgi:hypothetical protein